MIHENLVKTIVEGGGTIAPLIIDSSLTDGTGLCNSSLHYDGEKLRMILRNVEYTLHHCEGGQKYQSRYEGPLSYYHRDDDDSLRTKNFYCELNVDTLEIERCNLIDTSSLDVKPKWVFTGLEDARIVKWDDTFYACGVRRDTKTNGQGRMEFSKLEIGDESVVEVKRQRIEVPDKSSYCEKNWMPVKDQPYHFVKWCNPVEVVKVDLETNKATPVSKTDKTVPMDFDMRGGSHLIPWFDGTYLTIVHQVKFVPKNYNNFKDSDYYHRFIVWNPDFTIKHITKKFNFMTAFIEFSIGMEVVDEDVIITFGFQDNACYAIKCKKSYLDNLIWKELKEN